MANQALTFPIRYLRLQSVKGRKLWVVDMPAAFSMALILTAPYWIVVNANYFHANGFIDKIGNFTSVLTGFYVAGLLAVATFPRNEVGLDKAIEVGPIILPHRNSDDEYLTRREYVCAMFGYLAFASLIIAIASILCVTTADWLSGVVGLDFRVSDRKISISKETIRIAAIFVTNLVLAQVFVTTVRSLYYLIDRIYAVSPTPRKRDEDG